MFSELNVISKNSVYERQYLGISLAIVEFYNGMLDVRLDYTNSNQHTKGMIVDALLQCIISIMSCVGGSKESYMELWLVVIEW